MMFSVDEPSRVGVAGPQEVRSPEACAISQEPHSEPKPVEGHRQRQRERVKKRAQRLNELRGVDACASYARFSSDHQNEESISDQQRVCREHAEKLGLSITPDLEYSDEAVSGTKLRRAGLDSLIDAAKNQGFSILIVHCLSRLARELVITLPLLKKLVHSYGIRFISVSEGIDSDREGWEMIAYICCLFHEQYLKDLRANVLRGQEGTVLAGYSVGDCCFAYASEPIPGSECNRRGKNPKPRRRYVVIPELATWVVRVFYWFAAERRSIRWIIRQLNDQKVRKDHRSTTKEWHRNLIINMLSNPKYIGEWPWGEKTNVRDPETGNLKQSYRPSEESARWIRHFPELQIVSRELFEKAQQRLAEGSEKWKKCRRESGRLNGSSSECNGRTAIRLLHRVIVCDSCHSPFIYLMDKMKCRGHERCNCSIKSSISVEIAEKKVVAEIRKRLELDTCWFQRICQSTLRHLIQMESEIPQQLEAKERELLQLEGKISRLVDAVENGSAPQDLDSRLQNRRHERTALQREIARLRSRATLAVRPPTEEWIREQLDEMRDRLNESGAAANEVLRDLIDGPIRVYEVGPEKKRGRAMQGQFRLKGMLFRSDQPQSSTAEVDDSSSELITIDFVDDEQIEARRLEEEQQQDRAKQLFDQGLLNVEIAERLGVSRSRVTALIQRWHIARDLPVPHGTSRRYQMERTQRVPHLYQAISDRAMELYREGCYMKEIAVQLEVDCNTITSAIAYWHQKRGLPVPDGRSRLKGLRRNRR